MLPALHELLIEGYALLAEGTGLRRICREITADEAEDLLAVDLGLLGPAPEGPDSDDLAPEALDDTVREMAEQIAAAPAVTVKMAREVVRHLAQPQIRSSRP